MSSSESWSCRHSGPLILYSNRSVYVGKPHEGLKPWVFIVWLCAINITVDDMVDAWGPQKQYKITL